MKSEKMFLCGMVAAMFCWGLSWTSGKIISSYGPAENISMLRFLITTISMFPILLILKEKLTFNIKSVYTLLGAVFMLTIYSYLFLNGLKNGMPGAGGVLVTTLNPLITFVITMLLTRVLPTKLEILGLLIGAIASVFLLKIWDNENQILSYGNIYFLLASITWAILSRFTSQAKEYGSPFIFSIWMYMMCTVIMFILSDYNTTVKIITQSDFKFWFNLVFSATITTSIATTFYFYATSKIGVNKASSFIFLVPATAAIGSMLILGEKLEWYTICGGLLGIIAVYLIIVKKN